MRGPPLALSFICRAAKREGTSMLTLDKIYHAAFVLRDVARRTDLIAASRLNRDRKSVV